MKLPQRVTAAVRAQSGHPTGFWGRGAGLLMAHRSSIRKRNAWAVSLLDVQPDDRVDHSEVMLRQATRRNADGIRRGVVNLRLA